MLVLTVVMDSLGKVSQWTSRAEKLFGFTEKEAVGRSLGELIVPEAMRPYHEMGLRRYTATRDPHCVGFPVEVDALHRNGKTVPIEMVILPKEVGEELFFEAHVNG